MDVTRIAANINIKPTDRKMKQAKRIIGQSGLPVEMPLEKKFVISTEADMFEKVKNGIQIAIENMQRQV